jgi:hypothetical protein
VQGFFFFFFFFLKKKVIYVVGLEGTSNVRICPIFK